MLHGLQYLNDEDVEIDPILLKAEKRAKHEKEVRERKRKFFPDYAKRLAEAGLGDVLQDYVKKGQ